MVAETMESILKLIADWACQHPCIRAVALVGSWARGEARPDSDVDLLLLTDTPDSFRQDETWADAIDWAAVGVALVSWEDAVYGSVWSRHLKLEPETEVEMTFGALSWASTTPVDHGTLRVVGDGLRVLYDPQGYFAQLYEVVHRGTGAAEQAQDG